MDVWGRLRQQTKAARAELRASEEDRKTVLTIVVGDVAGGYFSLLELDSELDLAKRTLASREESLRLISARQQGGLATALDVRQAEELVYQASQTIPDTERLIEQTENQLSFITGNNPGPIRRGQALTQQETLPLVPAGLPSSLLERRPDIRAAEQNLVAQRALVSVARKAFLPRISLTGVLGFQSDQLSNLFVGPSRAWTFVPQVTAHLYRRTTEIRCEICESATGARTCSLSANDSKRLQGSIRCAHSISEGKRDTRSTGVAGRYPARPIATGISQV